jgi:hypothetical protein
MELAKHIRSTCSISNGAVLKDGMLLYSSSDVETPRFVEAAYKQLGINYARFYKMDKLSKLGWLTSEVLLQGNSTKGDYDPYQTSLVFANANASLESDIRYLNSVSDIASPALFVYTLPNIMIGEICIRNNFKGETAFFIAEGFDGVFMEQYVHNLFLTRDLKRCICGWVDVLADQYKAVLFLVEQGEGSTPFTADHMNLVFNKA